VSRPSPIGFAIEHIDNCERCSSGDFCDSGRSLMRRAAQIAAEILLPIPLSETPKAKA
jgi:hypothetical protein